MTRPYRIILLCATLLATYLCLTDEPDSPYKDPLHVTIIMIAVYSILIFWFITAFYYTFSQKPVFRTKKRK